MWHRCVDSLMYIKQCLHMLDILSVAVLLGSVSLTQLCISQKSPLKALSLCTNLDGIGQWLKHAFFFLARKGRKKGDPQAETPTDSVIA